MYMKPLRSCRRGRKQITLKHKQCEKFNRHRWTNCLKLWKKPPVVRRRHKVRPQRARGVGSASNPTQNKPNSLARPTPTPMPTAPRTARTASSLFQKVLRLLMPLARSADSSLM